MKHLKTFENVNEDDEQILEYYLYALFANNYLTFENIRDIKSKFNLQGYSTTVTRDDDPGDDYDYDNLPPKYKYYTIKKGEINIFQLLLNYTEGIVELGDVYYRNHYMDLIKKNWKIATDFIYEKMKNDLIKTETDKYNL